SRWATPLPAGGDRVVDDAGRAALFEASALRFDHVARVLRRFDAGLEHAEPRVRRGGRECRTGDVGQSAQRGSGLPAALAGSPGPSAELLREHSGPDLDGGGAESTGDEQLLGPVELAPGLAVLEGVDLGRMHALLHPV